MRQLIILGASGHGKVVADAAQLSDQWDEIIFYDDQWPLKNKNGQWNVVGTIKSFLESSPKNKNVVVAIGDNHIRMEIASKLRRNESILVNIFHPKSTISQYAKIESGTVVFAGAVINADASIGMDCIINTGATVDHDCFLAQAVHISPGANLSGNVSVESLSWIGVGASVRQGVTIGHGVVVGAGSVVISSLPDKVVVMGNPAKEYKKNKLEESMPNPWPSFTNEEAEAVKKILLSNKVNYWTGNECREFEREYAAYVGVPYAVAVANGTVALELALYALEIGLGDEVITTSRTYIASASCAVMRGAVPVVVDVDPESQNISPAAIRAAVTNKTKAIIVVHLAGWPCEMDEIMAIAKEFNLKVIEDCAQAHGATYKGRPVGSIGHAGAFSFCQDKIITTGGEGGMLTMQDENVWKRAWAFKDIGRSYDAVYNREHPPGFRWLTETFGTNWRLTEMQAVLGRIQLKKLNNWIVARRSNAAFMADFFSSITAVRLTKPPIYIGHAFYKYYVFVKPERLKSDWNRDRIIMELNERGVHCFSGSCSEIYLEKAFDNLPSKPKQRLAVAKELGETSLLFLVHPDIGQAYLEKSSLIIKEIFILASKT